MQVVVEGPVIEIIPAPLARVVVVSEVEGVMEKLLPREQELLLPPLTEVQAVGEVTRLVDTPGVETVLAV